MGNATPLVSLVTDQAYAGRDPSTGLVSQEDVVAFEYAWDSTNLQVTINASPDHPVYVAEVSHLVRTAFAGGTPSIEVGDGTTAAKYIATAAITETLADNLARSITGKKFTAPFVVLVTLSASLSAGAATVFVRLLRL